MVKKMVKNQEAWAIFDQHRLSVVCPRFPICGVADRSIDQAWIELFALLSYPLFLSLGPKHAILMCMSMNWAHTRSHGGKHGIFDH